MRVIPHKVVDHPRSPAPSHAAPSGLALPGRRAILAGLAVGLLTATVAPARLLAARDLLDTPALMTPRATRALLLGIARAGDRLVAVGERGVILTSDDHGGSWKQSKVPVAVNLTAVNFASPTKGWAVGHDGIILHSADGGQSWIKQFDGNKANELVISAARARLARVEAERGDSGSAADTPAADVSAAADGDDEISMGMSMASNPLEDARMALEDAEASGEFGPSRPLLDVLFWSDSDGLAIGSYGQIFLTRDGGASWTYVGLETGNAEGLHFNGISRSARGTILVSGEGGRLYRSTDNATSWEMFETGGIAALYGAAAVPAASGAEAIFAWGFGGRLHRLDGQGGLPELPAPSERTLVYGVVRNGQQGGSELLLIDNVGTVLAISADGTSSRQVLPSTGRPVTAVVFAANGQLVQVGMGGARAVQIA